VNTKKKSVSFILSKMKNNLYKNVYVAYCCVFLMILFYVVFICVYYAAYKITLDLDKVEHELAR